MLHIDTFKSAPLTAASPIAVVTDAEGEIYASWPNEVHAGSGVHFPATPSPPSPIGKTTHLVTFDPDRVQIAIMAEVTTIDRELDRRGLGAHNLDGALLDRIANVLLWLPLSLDGERRSRADSVAWIVKHAAPYGGDVSRLLIAALIPGETQTLNFVCTVLRAGIRQAAEPARVALEMRKAFKARLRETGDALVANAENAVDEAHKRLQHVGFAIADHHLPVSEAATRAKASNAARDARDAAKIERARLRSMADFLERKRFTVDGRTDPTAPSVDALLAPFNKKPASSVVVPFKPSPNGPQAA